MANCKFQMTNFNNSVICVMNIEMANLLSQVVKKEVDDEPVPVLVAFVHSVRKQGNLIHSNKEKKNAAVQSSG